MKPRSLAVSFAALIVSLALAPSAAQAAAAPKWTPYDRPAQNGIVTQKDVPITMPDGTVLSANVTRPDKPGRYPVILTQTPYGKDSISAFLGGGTKYLVQRGYAAVLVDVRGTGASGGTWDSFGPSEQRDGYDLTEWSAKQPWSNGKVGLSGGSYMGLNQLLTAALRPPHLKAIFPVIPMADGYRDIVFSGGDLNASFIPLWLGLVTAAGILPPAQTTDGTAQGLVSGLTTLASHIAGAVNFQAGTILKSGVGDDTIAFDGPFWKTRSPIQVVDRIKVPAFVVGGNHDLFQRGEPLIYERLKRHVETRLLMGPWTHVQAGSGKGLPRDGVPSLDQLQLRWFDKYLKGIDTKIASIPKVTQYVYGDERYETQADYPDPRLAPARWFLHGGKGLSPTAPKTSEASQSFVQQPLAGICTVSTDQWTAGLASPFPCSADERPNSLSGGAVYKSAPMPADFKLSGPVDARVWLTTSASDAAVTVRVEDVGTDGKTVGLTNGWLNARFRAIDKSRSRFVRGQLVQPWHPFTKASLLPVKAGAPTALDVEVFPVNAVIKKGHRLQITVDPADFPHQIPTLPGEQQRLGGLVKILTDPAHPSSIELPLLGKTCAVPAKRAKRSKKAKAKAKRTVATCSALPLPKLVR
jgi:putative CocE/NonD family hydrolase